MYSFKYSKLRTIICRSLCVRASMIEPSIIATASVRLLSHGAIEMVFKLQSHFIEARGQPPPKRGVRIAEGRAEIADNAAPFAMAPLAEHFDDGIQPAKHRIQ